MSGYKFIGKNLRRSDGPDKVKGQYHYLADSFAESSLYGAVLFSTHAHARVISIDTRSARSMPGVTVLTFEDAPTERYNSGEWFPGQNDPPDETILTGHVRHVGDRVALILAPDRRTALEARNRIKVVYEPLPPITDMLSAGDNAGLLHEDGVPAFPGRIEYGDIDAAFANPSFVERDTIVTPRIHHAAMETHAILVIPRAEQVLEIRSPCQIAFGVQHAVSMVVPLPLSKIRVIKVPMGGSFGGKQEVVFEPLCAWAAYRLGRPVFINTSREETMLATRTRAAAMGTIETALDAEGKILGRRVSMLVDAGAYLTGTKKVMMAMGKKISRLYAIPALRYEARAVRTSTTPAGACRGYGSPQIHAVTEIHTDLLCRRRGFDPVEFRLKNLIQPFSDDPSGGANLGNARIRDCLEQGLRSFGWQERKIPSGSGRFRRGAGFACATHGNGYYKTIYHDITGMSLRLLEDGSAVLRSGIAEMGHAANAAMAHIVAEVTGIAPERISVLEGDTLFGSYDIGCQASRGIFVVGECARLCAEQAMEKLCGEAERLWKLPVTHEGAVLRIGDKTVDLGDAVREIAVKNRVSIEVLVEHSPKNNPGSYGVHFVDLTVDTLTGLVHIDKYLAVHDIGQAIGRNLVEGQIYGAVQMGIGMALTEELVFDQKGQPSARNFDKYHMINAPDMPDVEILLIEEGEKGGPYGAKSIGEIATVPPAPAIINAVNRALSTSLTRMPLTPARIVAALNQPDSIDDEKRRSPCLS
ncbi:xanthine dehydrogenase family protein molybdopterin-binding subunit [Treponema primitia]|uniref:xanthine dehydrogenase family protein molybdopterin-binding subunit n=1 Tax=Treponema primitia TaxID=88058 RepID=UPI0002554F9E|nr:molybdopterin cofactor-binding domain-containing protein [Treponema primitia]